MTETITTLSVEDVYPHPKNNRERLDGIEELAASIAENGLLSPIRVKRDGEIYWIIAGHRRHAAITALGLGEIEAIVEDDGDDASAIKKLVADNALTSPLNDIERSRGIQEMLALGVRPEAAAASAGEKPERVKRAVTGLKLAADYAEDMSLDRIIALADFEDDPEAVKQLLTVPEARWQSLAADLKRQKLAERAAEEAREIVKAAGCELVEDTFTNTRRDLGSGIEVPEGAKYGAVRVQTGNGTATIVWYTDASEDDDPEAAAMVQAQAERDTLLAALSEASAARLAFIADNIEMCSHLRRLAEDAWEGDDEDMGFTAEARELEGTPLTGVRGFTARVTASLLALFETSCARALADHDGHSATWVLGQYADDAMPYMKALALDGYEPTEIEAERAKSLKAAVEAGERDG
ncbi:MAG: ParB/RepB/Spo0J family partition protein [Coriobacteriia bacterium]|nr:ParB/RepB/Spo0J family partition protein [Coriobacteriia bacterium]